MVQGWLGMKVAGYDWRNIFSQFDIWRFNLNGRSHVAFVVIIVLQRQCPGLNSFTCSPAGQPGTAVAGQNLAWRSLSFRRCVAIHGGGGGERAVMEWAKGGGQTLLEVFMFAVVGLRRIALSY